ncbi:GtrA family protein [Streptomyces sp. KR80]|uniref:GtrA family protein n=1 Tax=Streptomyces sp. KR80 TaxID=3457426 RepID=UPI003FD23B84
MRVLSSWGARALISAPMTRFALVGVVNTGTYYVFYRLLHLWLPYLVAHVVATLLSMVGSFFLNVRFTYRTRPTWRKFLLFPLTNATNLLLTTVGVYVLVSTLGMDSRIAPLLAAAGAIPVTYLVSRLILVPSAPDAPAPTNPPALVEGRRRS